MQESDTWPTHPEANLCDICNFNIGPDAADKIHLIPKPDRQWTQNTDLCRQLSDRTGGKDAEWTLDDCVFRLPCHWPELRTLGETRRTRGAKCFPESWLVSFLVQRRYDNGLGKCECATLGERHPPSDTFRSHMPVEFKNELLMHSETVKCDSRLVQFQFSSSAEPRVPLSVGNLHREHDLVSLVGITERQWLFSHLPKHRVQLRLASVEHMCLKFKDC